MPILVGSSSSAAELPFAIYDNDNVPVTGYSFSTGDVRVRAPNDSSFGDADTDNIVECGNGQYVLQLTAGQTAAEGAVLIYFSDGANRDFSGYEMITSTTDEVLVIPFSVYEADGDGVLDGVEGFSFTTGDLTIRLPNETSFSDADTGNIEELGLGQYVYILTEAERANPGAIMVCFADGVNRPYFGYELNALETASEDDDEVVTPIAAATAEVTISTYAHSEAMLNRLPEYARQEVL